MYHFSFWTNAVSHCKNPICAQESKITKFGNKIIHCFFYLNFLFNCWYLKKKNKKAEANCNIKTKLMPNKTNAMRHFIIHIVFKVFLKQKPIQILFYNWNEMVFAMLFPYCFVLLRSFIGFLCVFIVRFVFFFCGNALSAMVFDVHIERIFCRPVYALRLEWMTVNEDAL